jgi:hypothetical protein
VYLVDYVIIANGSQCQSGCINRGKGDIIRVRDLDRGSYVMARFAADLAIAVAEPRVIAEGGAVICLSEDRSVAGGDLR